VYWDLIEKEGNTDEAKYARVMQPVYMAGNAYAGSASPWRHEAAPLKLDTLQAFVGIEDGRAVLTMDVPESFNGARTVSVSTEMLGMPRCTECPYDDTDGKPFDFAPDLLGVRRGEHALPGPLAQLAAGRNRIVIWTK